MKMAKFSKRIEKKHLWEKEKLLVKSNFPFSQIVFERLMQQTHKNQGLFEKGLTLDHTIPGFNNLMKETSQNPAFPAFPAMFFVLYQGKNLPFEPSMICGPPDAFNSDQSEILMFGKKVILYQMTKL